VGILTKGAIIEGMLKRLSQELQEEEIRQYRASHIFEDIVAEYKEIYLTYEIVGKDFDKAGHGSMQMKKNLKRLGIRPDIIHRLAIASYEAEINSVIYSDGGIMAFRVTPGRGLHEGQGLGTRASRTSSWRCSPAGRAPPIGCGRWDSAPAWASRTSARTRTSSNSSRLRAWARR
jgi:hypothetical protein